MLQDLKSQIVLLVKLLTRNFLAEGQMYELLVPVVWTAVAVAVDCPV